MINNINNIKYNRKGSTLTNWVFLVLGLSLLIVMFQTQVLNPMNEMYDNNLSVGLNQQALNNINSFTSQATGSKDEIENAEISRTSEGLTSVSAGVMTINIFKLVWSFAGGEFIDNLLTQNLDFPPIVAKVISILILFSLVFIIIRIFMRGTTP